LDEKFYIEINCQQRNHGEERVCGDVFLSKRIKEEGRKIVVLSDGMGHGIKANLLATLTATLAVSFKQDKKDIRELAGIIRSTLPYDSVRNMNYSTFTIVEVDAEGWVEILEFENPRTLIIRGNHFFDPVWNGIVVENLKNEEREVLFCRFKAKKEDRVVFCSDGVIQSGLGSERFPKGWGMEKFQEFLAELLTNEPGISATKLVGKVLNKANQNDQFHPKDDISCVALYFREPRKLMICTGPPLDPGTDALFARILADFDGHKIVCGATTGQTIAREWGKEIVDSALILDTELPPFSNMDGVDLITEGILTLSKVNDLLKKFTPAMKLTKGPADEIVRMVLDSDEIHFLVGTKINEAHQDPTLPVDLELRRTVVHRIARVLEEKYLKEVSMRFY
jgi:hypothetical protein